LNRAGPAIIAQVKRDNGQVRLIDAVATASIVPKFIILLPVRRTATATRRQAPATVHIPCGPSAGLASAFGVSLTTPQIILRTSAGNSAHLEIIKAKSGSIAPCGAPWASALCVFSEYFEGCSTPLGGMLSRSKERLFYCRKLVSIHSLCVLNQ
jgi:hypothetical protein